MAHSSGHSSLGPSSGVPSTTQFLHSLQSTDRPIFGRRKINHVPPHPVAHVVVSSKRIVLVLANKTIQRVDQSKEDVKMDTVDLSKDPLTKSCKIGQVFLDPLGAHLVLTLKPTGHEALPDLIYLHHKSSKIKPSSKIRGHLVTAIAWNYLNTSENVTGPILVGTSRGLIFETELDSGEDHMFTHSLEKYWGEPLFDMAKGSGPNVHSAIRPITGLEYHRIPHNKYFILATTSDRLYQFQGYVNNSDVRPLLISVFQTYSNIPEQFLELPSTVKYSTLAYFHRTKQLGKQEAELPLFPAKFAWLTGSGIYAGTINPYSSSTADAETGVTGSSRQRKEETVTVDCQLVPLLKEGLSMGDAADEVPNSIVLTEFHALLAYPSRVVGLCLLNEAVVFEDDLDQSGRLKGISRDPVSGVFYVFTDYAIYQYSVVKEERHVWKIFLQKGDIDSAERYCLGDEEKLDKVRTKKAQDYYNKGKYVESALCYAMTHSSFEEVALKFMRPEVEKDGQAALLTFLKRRLETVKSSEKTQLTMLVVWLFEIYLNMIGNKSSSSKRARMLHGDVEDMEAALVDEVEDALDDQTSEELFSLMKIPKVAECIASNRTTFYDLLASHGDKKNMIRFAHALQDFDRVIRLHLQDGEYESVLDVLEIQLAKRNKPDLFYNYGPLLMPEVPRRFVDSIIKQGSHLNPVKLIPSLVVSYRDDQEQEAIRYLEYSVKTLGSKERAIHNYLLSLYIKHQKEKVLLYLEDPVRCGSVDNPAEVYYDINYALRLCTEQQDQLRNACVRLHCILGQLDQVVELALSDPDADGLEQAKACLSFTKLGTDSNEGKDKARRIWLRIARYVVQDKNDIKQAMEFLRECEGLVKIEDILPFFPDFVTIDHFKDAICDSLQEYSKHIQDLKDEMEEAYASAEEIRSDIQQFKGRYVFVRADDTCSICQEYVMARPFHLFVCSHR